MGAGLSGGLSGGLGRGESGRGRAGGASALASREGSVSMYATGPLSEADASLIAALHLSHALLHTRSALESSERSTVVEWLLQAVRWRVGMRQL